jgi:hypothetical protein
MRFSRRLIKVSDLSWCSDMLEDGFENEPEIRCKLPQLWANLLFEGALIMIIVNDDIRQRRVSFAAAGIVSDEFAKSIAQAEAPHVSLRAMRYECEPNKSQILRIDEIRKVNHPGHGVNLLIFHYSELVDEYARDEIRVVRDTSLRALLELQSGYALREVDFEFYGDEDVPYATAMGFKIRSSYSKYYAGGEISLPSAEKRPHLAGLSSEELKEGWGSPIGALFSYSRPYLFFTTAQQNVLSRALLKYSDKEIADELGISAWTVKEHWKTTFERVQDTQSHWPAHLKILPEKRLQDEGKAASNLRAKLLTYLSQHPSELRPVDRKYFTDGETIPGSS